MTTLNCAGCGGATALRMPEKTDDFPLGTPVCPACWADLVERDLGRAEAERLLQKAQEA